MRLLILPPAVVPAVHTVSPMPAQEEQFERTCALVREVGFDRVNTAAYSPRPGTPAALWPDQVAELVKLDRLNRLNRITTEVAAERAQRFLGRDVEVNSAELRAVSPRRGAQTDARVVKHCHALMCRSNRWLPCSQKADVYTEKHTAFWWVGDAALLIHACGLVRRMMIGPLSWQPVLWQVLVEGAQPERQRPGDGQDAHQQARVLRSRRASAQGAAGYSPHR